MIFEIEGEAGFRKREAEMLSELVTMENIVLATGGGAVLSQENREMLRRRYRNLFTGGGRRFMAAHPAGQESPLAKDFRTPAGHWRSFIPSGIPFIAKQRILSSKAENVARAIWLNCWLSS